MGSAFSRKFDPETDVGDLSGKIILVTGGKYVASFSLVYRAMFTLQF